MKKKGLLYKLIFALLTPTMMALFFAWIIYDQFESSMESISGSYVQNLVDSVAARLDSKKWSIVKAGAKNVPVARDINTMASLLSEMNLPGIFVVVQDDGDLVYGTPGQVNLLMEHAADFNALAPVKIRVSGGHYLTGMTYRIPSERLYIVAAVQWQKLFGPMVLLVSVWPFVMGLMAVFMILAIYLLYEKVILPLRDFDDEVSSLRLGYELPAEEAPEAVPELQQLRSTFVVLAQSAIDKEQLSRDYVTDIIKAQEEERERISREIHDGPLQDVTALVQRLRLLELEVDGNQQIMASLDNAEKVAMIGVKELREFCNNLTPPWLDLGLAHSLQELCNRMSVQLGVKIDLEIVDDLEYEENILPLPLCLAFYRVAQESINNSVHHGNSTLISVLLERKNNTIFMRIEDNGSGFTMPEDIKELRIHGHRGLSNMKERIRLAGGTLIIDSKPGFGTITSCEVPSQSVE
ncbi:MAG: histidine kinase [Cloacibacillus sp.]